MANVANQQELPPLFRRHVRRPRLTALIEETSAQSVIIRGPPGYGKTTLATEWAQGRKNIVWCRPTAASADVAAFSTELADAAASIVADAGARLRQRLRVAEAPEKLARPLAELLADDLARWPEDAWLIVDDYHLVAESSAVEEFVDWLLLGAPLRLLVTTRRRPAWASARRVLYGEILEIRHGQLAMTNDEAAQVLDSRPTEAVHAIVKQAEGWPAVIGLAGLAASSKLPDDQISEELFRYFAEEVFRQEPPDVQQFMLAASVPNQFDRELARSALGYAQPERYVSHLVSRGILRESGGQFSFHPLLRNFLVDRLDADDNKLAQRLVEGVVTATRGSKDFERGFDIAIRQNRLDLAAEVTRDAARHLLVSGRIELLNTWLRACGDLAVTDTALSMARAEILTLEGRLSEAVGLTQQIVSKTSFDSPFLSRALFLSGQALNLSADYRHGLEYHVKAGESAMTRGDLLQALWGRFIAEAELGSEAARRTLDELDTLTEPGDIDGSLRVAIGRQLLASQHGSFEGLWDSIRYLVPLADHAADPMAKSTFLANVSYLNVARGNYGVADHLAKHGIEYCQALRLDFAVGYCLSHRAAAEIGLRRFVEAKHTLAQMAEIVQSHEDPTLALSYRSLSIKLLLALNDASGRPFEMATFDERPPSLAARGEHLGLAAILSAAQAEVDLARQLAASARELTSAVEATFYSQVAELLSLLREEGLSDEARDRAISLALESNKAEFVDGLVVAYRSDSRILTILAANPLTQRISSRVVQLSNDQGIAKAEGILQDPYLGQQPPLSPRELQVVELLHQGLSNKEIGQRLFIAPGTVKTHLRNIYKKLGAKSRTQAVSRWQTRVKS